MDAAVGLVQSYLRLNGYFTETEYPVLRLEPRNPVTVTDVDLLAVRFSGASRWSSDGRGRGIGVPPDPILDVTTEAMDMIIAEVKEGKPRLHPSIQTPEVVEAVLRRFGCCADDLAASARAVVHGRKAETQLAHGMTCRIRMMVFGGSNANPGSPYNFVSLRHVVQFISREMREYADVFLHSQLKDDTLGLLALIAKLGLSIQ
jgi:hypothetical protein